LYNFPVSVVEVIKASRFATLDDIAQHNDASYLFLLDHELEIFLRTFEGGLAYYDSFGGTDPHRISVYVSLMLIVFMLQLDSAMLVFISGALQMDC